MEPVVYDFAINERGTRADLLRGRRGADARRLLHADRARRCCARDPRLLPAAAPRRAGPLRRRLPRRARSWPAWCRPCSTTCCRAPPGTAPAAAQSLEALLERYGFDRVQHEQIRADLRAGRIGLAQNRLPASSAIEDVAPRRRAATPRAACPNRCAARAWTRWPPARWPWSRWPAAPAAAGRKGAGVVKALNPFCPAGRAASQLPRGPPGQEPPHRAPVRHRAAARHHHQLPDARRRRTAGCARSELRLPRPAAPLARPQHRAAPGPHGARPALRLGGDAAAAARRAGAEGAREPARRPDRLGRAGGRGQRLHRQPAPAVPPPGRPLVRGAQPAAQRRAGRACSTSGRACAT